MVRVLLALALACSACSGGATQASRKAWDNALDRKTGPVVGTTRPGGGRGTTPTRPGDVWQQLANFTTDAVDLLADGSTTISLPRLASQLCDEVPDALSDDPAARAVECAPKQPLTLQGHDLRLELARASSISLYARELTDSSSEQLVRQTMRQLASACREPWTPVPSRADNAHEEFHTCPTSGGAMLVLGRFPSDLGGGRWQFSLAVLGPG